MLAVRSDSLIFVSLGLMRIALVPLALLLVGCAAVDVRGPYANRLSPADIREIKSFVTSEPRLISPWIHITAVAPDRVQLEHGGLTSSDGMTIDGNEVFKMFAVKRGGKWSEDERFGLELSGGIIAWR
jgi:hypothetical protein